MCYVSSLYINSLPSLSALIIDIREFLLASLPLESMVLQRVLSFFISTNPSVHSNSMHNIQYDSYSTPVVFLIFFPFKKCKI